MPLLRRALYTEKIGLVSGTGVSSESHTLVVGPSWVGDMVMAQSLFMALKQQAPTAAIDVLAPAWSRPLLERMPEVSHAIEMPLGHGQLQLMARYHLGKSLRARRYRLAIVLPNSLKSALVPFWAGIPQRRGYRGEMRYGLINQMHALDKQTLPMTVQRFVALASDTAPQQSPAYEAPRLSIQQAGIDTALANHRLSTDKPILVLCPGAEYGAAKRWPATHFSAVARHYLEQGWQVWLFGSHKDTEQCDAIHRLCQQRTTNLVGKTTLSEVIDLMSLAGYVVSNDSGLMHIAASLNRPLIALYGSSDPGFTPPLNSQARVMRLGLPCSPCFRRDCPFGHTDCLNKLTAESVLTGMQAANP